MKLRKRDKAILPHLSREITSQLAVRAFMNAAALQDAATLLYERGHYGSARSLAISAREECGKGFAAGCYLAGIISDEEFAAGLRDHSFKQAEGLVIPTLASAFLDRPDLLRALLPEGTTALKPEVFASAAARIEEQMETLAGELSGYLDLLRNRRTNASEGADERSRQAGLYVSLEGDENGVILEYPQQITAEQAAEELDWIRMFLKAVLRTDEEGIPSDLWSDNQSTDQIAKLLDKVFPHGLFEENES